MDEAVTRAPQPPSDLAAFRRFIASLPLLRRVLPAALVLIAGATGLPQVYLWYIGRLTECTAAGTKPCRAALAAWEVDVTLRGLALIALLAMLLRVASWMLFELCGMVSTKALHDRMVAGLSRARTTFFDEEASPQIVSRLIGDFGQLRGIGIFRLSDTCNSLIEAVAVALLISLVNPWPTLLMIPSVAAVLYCQVHIGAMRGRARELAAAAKATLVHRVSDLVDGGAVYRLYGKENALSRRLSEAYRRKLDGEMLLGSLQAWGRFWVKSAAGVFGFFVVLFLTIQISRGEVSAPLAAVVMSAVFALEGIFTFLSLSVMALGESLGSARRVFTLVDLPAELDCERAGRRPAAVAAPVPAELAAGQAQPLRFVDFSMSYRPGGREALHGVELTLPAGRRVGLVGRTGSGKSSLIQALLRMVHVTRGDILVGDRSIYELDLEQWRALFAIVPQSPHLFAGTVRGNLDRLGLYDDDLLRLALRRVGLSFAPEMTIAPSGANLSLGERQLLCMARALLVQRPFLILDEPTSAMDNLTDARVQAALREVSRDVTVLTIAHRLETIAGYDLIVEMSDGRVTSVTAKDGVSQALN